MKLMFLMCPQLFVIDQHAADDKFTYERLRKSVKLNMGALIGTILSTVYMKFLSEQARTLCRRLDSCQCTWDHFQLMISFFVSTKVSLLSMDCGFVEDLGTGTVKLSSFSRAKQGDHRLENVCDMVCSRFSPDDCETFPDIK